MPAEKKKKKKKNDDAVRFRLFHAPSVAQERAFDADITLSISSLAAWCTTTNPTSFHTPSPVHISDIFT